MDTVSSAIAFAQAAEICLSLAKSLIRRYRSYSHANDQIAELILTIEGIWVKTETQVATLSSIEDSIEPRLLIYLNQCLERLETKLRLARAEIETLTGSTHLSLSIENLALDLTTLKRVKYSILEKHLRKTVQDLQSWHAVFDPSWFLISLINNSKVDQALADRVEEEDQNQNQINSVKAIRDAIQDIKTARSPTTSTFRDDKFLSPQRTQLEYSSLTVAYSPALSADVIVDSTAFGPDVDKIKAATHIRDLARILAHSTPSTLGLLQCVGVLKILDATGNISDFQFAFSIPPSVRNPASLRLLLTAPAACLDAKYRLAKFLARSVMAVHSADFVHKNIRPETVIVFEDPQTPSLPVPFLVGFERFRPAAAGTHLTGDMVWERNLYRFPNRQGIKPEHAYIMQHDIYSLGVCLLEVGIWSSFVLPSSSNNINNHRQPGPILDIAAQLAMSNKLQAAWEIKRKLIALARAELPVRMGLVYTKVVISCLTCLDSGALNFFADAKDLYDQDGILVGVAFIEKILLKLEGLSI